MEGQKRRHNATVSAQSTRVSRAINNRCFLAGPAGKGEAQSSAQRANCFGYLPHLTWIRTWVTDVISGTNVMSTVIDFLYSVVLCTKHHNIRLEVRLCQAGRERERSCSVSSGCECYVWLPTSLPSLACKAQNANRVSENYQPAPLTLPRQSRPLGTMPQRDRVAGSCGAGSDPGLTGGEGGLGYHAH